MSGIWAPEERAQAALSVWSPAVRCARATGPDQCMLVGERTEYHHHHNPPAHHHRPNILARTSTHHHNSTTAPPSPGLTGESSRYQVKPC